MIFKYETSKLKEYRKNGILAIFPLLFISPLAVLPILYISMSMQGIESAFFIISLTFIMTIISAVIGILMGYKKAKKEFESYQIECNDKVIVITSKMTHKEIKIEQIKKILKDNKNNIYIVENKISRIKILHFIENVKEFETYLSNIIPIGQYSIKYDFFQFMPAICLIALMYISKIGNLQLYLIFAVIVMLITLYSMIQLFFNQLRLKTKIIALIVNGFIVFSVIRGIYTVLVYLKKY